MSAVLLAVAIVAVGSFIGCICAMAFVARMKRRQTARTANVRHVPNGAWPPRRQQPPAAPR